MKEKGAFPYNFVQHANPDFYSIFYSIAILLKYHKLFQIFVAVQRSASSVQGTLSQITGKHVQKLHMQSSTEMNRIAGTMSSAGKMSTP